MPLCTHALTPIQSAQQSREAPVATAAGAVGSARSDSGRIDAFVCVHVWDAKLKNERFILSLLLTISQKFQQSFSSPQGKRGLTVGWVVQQHVQDAGVSHLWAAERQTYCI